MNEKKTILITSIGKRVQLIKHLKKKFKIVGVDAGDINAGRYFVDEFYKIPKATESNYIEVLLYICKKENVKGLIPLYEGEFQTLNIAREKFEKQGTFLILSGEEVVNICKDKKLTYENFLKSKIKLPKVYYDSEINELIEKEDITKFPLFIKPVDGMGSSNAFRINNINELKFFREYIKNNIIQECIEGEEYTVDCLVDFNGNPIYVVPRKRIEVRSGEVVKSSTVHDDDMINNAIEVIKHLNKVKDKKGLGAIGPLTIQFFKDKHENAYLIEINPRFGGGVPLSFEAGADYGRALNTILNEEEINYINEFEEKTMLRYDEAVFF
ncbi:carbamoylphosphate synthase large subunit [Clostridium carnis]|uniref:Carbamoylphosphate synthase large subunit n=1 Tax=Clostridium carnis TaxID=1530 RepID=A0ABY6SWH7_9CLOT|nr:ATP-grasp domain-containing protein [Clostridium carnis]VDG72424.1 carbamoylphosphate synthase large subunit [Clostridium carnis]